MIEENEKDYLSLDKLRHRMENTKLHFLPQNLYKLINYVKFSKTNSYDQVIRRILLLKFIGFITFSPKLAIKYQIESIHKLNDFDFDEFEWLYAQVFIDSQIIFQRFKESNIDLREKDFSNVYNLVSGHINRSREYIIDVACYIYIYQRMEVPLEKKGSN